MMNRKHTPEEYFYINDELQAARPDIVLLQIFNNVTK
jgi:hypothetical protein